MVITLKKIVNGAQLLGVLVISAKQILSLQGKYELQGIFKVVCKSTIIKRAHMQHIASFN